VPDLASPLLAATVGLLLAAALPGPGGAAPGQAQTRAPLVGEGGDALVAPRPARFAAPVERFITVDAPAVALTGVTLIDGTGSPAREGMTVVTAGERIVAVSPDGEAEIPADAVRIDGSGHTLTPGWVMLHEHMFYPSGGTRYNTNEVSFPPLYLGGGATTVRTGGSVDPYTDLSLRRDINAGRIPGPRMDVTGPYLEGPGGFIRAFPALETPAQARAHVDFWMDRGVTSFKGYNLIDRATLRAAVERAHERGAKVTAHLCSITYREAAALGIDNLEHGFRVATDFVAGKEPDACPSGRARQAAAADFDPDGQAFVALADDLIAAGVTITATPTVFERGSTGRPLPPEAALAAIAPSLRERVRRRYTYARDNPSPRAQEQFARFSRALAVFHDRGGAVVVGIDPTGGGDVVPGWANQRAVSLLVEAGFTPEEAVQVATLNGARYLEVADQIGSVEKGKRADLVLMSGDLRTDPETVRRVVLVFKDGVGYDSAALLGSVEGTVGIR
jgi:enamidase